jgi:hypothetical protein
MRASRAFFAAAFFSGACAAIACRHTDVPEPATAPTHPAPTHPAPTPAPAPAPAHPAPAPAPTHPAPAPAPVPDLSLSPVSAKSIGHTSYVLKLVFSDGHAAAYKPASTRPLGAVRYKGEIAAYRLAQALGLPNVPRAIPRSFAASALRASFTSTKGAAQFDRNVRVDPAGQVHGALIPWIADYREIPLERVAWRSRWEPWLMNPKTAIPAREESLAASISTMLVFDYVTANWDRWSGGNVARAGAEGTLLFVDNDGAFYEHPRTTSLAAQLGRLRRVVRFSKSFVVRLRTLDEAALREALGEESSGAALLPDAVILDVLKRAKIVLQVIDGCVARRGADQALAFE